MAWTAPKTWTQNEVVTAGDMNAQIRDNMLDLRAGRVAQVRTLTDGSWDDPALRTDADPNSAGIWFGSGIVAIGAGGAEDEYGDFNVTKFGVGCPSLDMGAETVGRGVSVGRNSNTTNKAPGYIELCDKDGTWYMLWVASGVLRIVEGSGGIAGSGEGTGVAVGSQS